MNKRWTKLISLLCVVALLAGLLVMPAAAVNDSKNYWSFGSKTVPDSNASIFSIYKSSVGTKPGFADAEGEVTTISEGKKSLTAYMKWETGTTIEFTAPDDGRVYLYLQNVAGNLKVTKGSEKEAAVTVSSLVFTVDTVKDTHYKIAKGSGNPGCYYVEWVDMASIPADGNVTGVEITSANTVKVGQNIELKAEVTMDSGEDTEGVTWSIDETAGNTGALELLSSNRAYGVTAGEVTIKATSKKDTSKSTTQKITVEAAETGTTVDSNVHTFESKNVAACADKANFVYAQDNYFQIIMTSANSKFDETSDKDWTSKDGNENYKLDGKFNRFSTGSDATKDGPGIQFTTGAKAKVQIWWVVSNANREMAIRDVTGDSEVFATSVKGAKDAVEYSEFELENAGTYIVGSKGGSNYLMRVTVTEETEPEDISAKLSVVPEHEEVESTGGVAYVKVDGLPEDAGIDDLSKAITVSPNEGVSVAKNTSGLHSDYPVAITLPANETDADKEYTITFTVPEDNAKYTGSAETKVTVNKAGDVTIKITERSASSVTVKPNENLVLSVDAVAHQYKGGVYEDEPDTKLTFAWTQGDTALTDGTDGVTIVETTLTDVEGHKGHTKSTLTVPYDKAVTGTYTVTVSAEGATSNSHDFTVKVLPPVTSVSITAKPTGGMKVDDTFSFKATVNPTDAAYKGVYWLSSDADVLTINEITGAATAKKVGKATITAYAVEDDTWTVGNAIPAGTKSASVEITVAEKPDVPPVEEDPNAWIASEATLPAADAKSPVLLKDFEGLKAYATTGDKAFQLQTKASGKVYIQGDGNPKLSDGKTNPSVTAMPEVGAYYYFVATADGTLTVDFFCGKNKNMFVTNGTTALEGYNGGVLDENNDTEGTFTIEIKAGDTYYAFCTGSKLMVHKITFVAEGKTDLFLDPASVEVKVGETADVTYEIVGDAEVVAVTATSADAKTATATVGEGKVTIEGVAAGSTVVTVKAELKDGTELTKSVAVKVVGEEENPPAQDGTYTVTVDTVPHGTVTADKTKDLKAGDKVTLTVTPETGYKLDTLTVTDKDGKAVEVDMKAYTFIMPASNVTVKATFVEDSQEPKPPVTTGKVLTGVNVHAALVEAGKVAADANYIFDDGEILKDQGPDGMFTIYGRVGGSTKIDSTDSAVFDGYKFNYRINLGGKVAVKEGVMTCAIGFKTTGPATVNVWAVSGGAGRHLGLFDAEGNDVVLGTVAADTNTPFTETLKIPAAGEYFLGGKEGNDYIIMVEVIDEGGGTVDPTKPSLTVTPATLDLKVGETGTLTATLTGSDEAITWESDKPEVATVDNGTVTAVAAGTATITAKAGELTATATVTVTEEGGEEPDEISVTINTSKVTVKKTVKLSATVTPADAEYDHLYWVSDDTDVLTVDNTDGTATGVKAGKATVHVYVLDDKGNTLAEAEKEITVSNVSVNYGGGGSTTGQTTTPATTKTNSNGDTVKTETKSNGDKTVTVTDKDGNVLVTLQIPAQTPDLGYKFTDVPDDHWAEPSIQAMAAMKVFQGVSSTGHIFDMNSSVTRGTMAQILFNLSQGKAGINNPFTDAQGNWYSDAVAWAASVGVVTGVSDTNFAPNDSITREQLITMLYRYAQLLALDTNVTADMGKFVDADEIDSWASAAMTWAVGKGLIIGKGAGNLDPKAAASRAEAAVIIDRFLQMVK